MWYGWLWHPPMNCRSFSDSCFAYWILKLNVTWNSVCSAAWSNIWNSLSEHCNPKAAPNSNSGMSSSAVSSLYSLLWAQHFNNHVLNHNLPILHIVLTCPTVLEFSVTVSLHNLSLMVFHPRVICNAWRCMMRHKVQWLPLSTVLKWKPGTALKAKTNWFF